MSCEDTEALVHAYMDGELDLVRSLEIEKHLDSCPACAHTLEDHRTLGTALREGSLYYRAPRQLAGRIDVTLRRAAPSGWKSRRMSWPMLAVAASLLLAGSSWIA